MSVLHEPLAKNCRPWQVSAQLWHGTQRPDEATEIRGGNIARQLTGRDSTE